MIHLIFLGIGILFNLLGAIGLHRMPDVYTKLHAGTKCTTFGTIFISLAVIIHGFSSNILFSTHTFIALAAILLTNPTSAHALARASHKIGMKPEKDALEAQND